MKKCAIYARVSTPDQRVDNQLYDLRLFAQQRGFEVVAEYTDVGISGSKARRPGLDAMLREARKRKFSVLIVAAFDRLARSTKHFLTVVDELDYRLLDGLAGRHHPHVDLPLPSQPDTCDEARSEVDHGSIDSGHTGVRVEHYRPPPRRW